MLQIAEVNRLSFIVAISAIKLPVDTNEIRKKACEEIGFPFLLACNPQRDRNTSQKASKKSLQRRGEDM